MTPTKGPTLAGRIRGAVLWFLCGALAMGLVRWQWEPRPTAVGARGVLPAGMDRRIGHLEFRQERLDRALARLGEAAGCPVVVRWPALFSQGVNEFAPIEATMNDVPLSAALKVVLAQAGGNLAALDFRADGGTVLVSVAGDLEIDEYELRMYDIGELVRREVERDRRYRRALPSTQPASAIDLYWEPRSGEDEIEMAEARVVDALQMVLQPRSRGGQFGGRDGHGWNGNWHSRLAVYETPAYHARVRAALELLGRMGLPGVGESK